jgi:glycosyltransferase involved in cell wall biosynthesis
VLREAGFDVSARKVGESKLHYRLHRLGKRLSPKWLAAWRRFASAASRLHPNYFGLQHRLARAVRSRSVRCAPYDVNLFLDIITPKWFPYARVNCLIPNHEWFRPYWCPFLRHFDWVLCKTRVATRVFRDLGANTEYISFTSEDRLDRTQPKDHDAFLHISSSFQKGTDAVMDVWLRHPEWPRLKLIHNPRYARPLSAENIDYVDRYVNDDELLRLQNSHGIHLCPSEIEGFGHSIVEAMSCRSVTVTTDGPPMNELISPERGLLVAHQAAYRWFLGARYPVDSAALERRILEVMGMSHSAKRRLAENAREWFCRNDRFFRSKLAELVAAI